MLAAFCRRFTWRRSSTPTYQW